MVVRNYSISPSTDNNSSLWLRNINTTTSADTTLFRVNNNGNVGIGTITPAYNLDVSGTGRITGNLIVDTDTLFVDASNNRVGIGTINPSTTLDVSGTANITGNLSVDTNTFFVDASNNRVGIGTINPSYNLVVSDASNSLTKIGVRTTAGTIGNFAGIGFGTSGNSTNLKSAIGHLCTASTNGIGALIFANNSVADSTPA